MAPPRRKLRVARVLERTVDLAVAAVASSKSSKLASKLAADLARQVQVVKHLATGRDDQRFDKEVQAVIIKLVKLNRKLLRNVSR